MSALQDEVDANFLKFSSTWPQEVIANQQSLQTEVAYKRSYRRIAAIQALKAEVVCPRLGSDIGSFFVEAQNDVLLSHVQAGMGSWRSSLQCLRSSIENVFCCFYFMDHPVEFALWKAGKFRIGFSEMCTYFDKHPRLASLPKQVTGLAEIKSEYAMLSKAVHGSAVNFWMTAETATISLWNTKPVRANMWETREKRTLQGLCLLTLCLFSDSLTGTQKPGVREVVGLSFSKGPRVKIRQSISVNLG